jgi:hypothetical protein
MSLQTWAADYPRHSAPTRIHNDPHGTGGLATGALAVAIGPLSAASGADSIAIGVSATASGTESIAIGDTTVASGTKSIAFGHSASATASFAAAIGYTASATANSAVALGGVTNSLLNSVSLGTAGFTLFKANPSTAGNIIYRRIPSTDATNTITLTAAQCLAGLFKCSFAGGIAVTLPTGALLDANAVLASDTDVNMSFECKVAATNAAGVITFSGAAGTTILFVGLQPANTTKVLHFVRTAAATWEVY